MTATNYVVNFSRCRGAALLLLGCDSARTGACYTSQDAWEASDGAPPLPGYAKNREDYSLLEHRLRNMPHVLPGQPHLVMHPKASFTIDYHAQGQ